MSHLNSTAYTKTIEEAVRHPLWTREEQVGMISRHNERLRKSWRDKSAGFFMEKTK